MLLGIVVSMCYSPFINGMLLLGKWKICLLRYFNPYGNDASGANHTATTSSRTNYGYYFYYYYWY